MLEPIVLADEKFERDFAGLVVSFDLHRTGGKVSRESGQVVTSKWLGLTKRGLIPEYELTIMGKTGKTVSARLVEHYVRPVD